jgi:hypothetical protein
MAPRRLILVAAVGLLLAHGTVGWGAPAKVSALTELDVNETVDGDVVALGGDVVLGPKAVVRGHAVAVFGSVRAAPGARVEGRMIGLASLAGLAVEPIAGESGARVRTAVRLLTAGAWLLATTLLAFLWPARIRYGATVLPQLGLKVAVLGGMVAITLVAALIAAIGLGPMAGLPLAAVLGVAFLAVKAIGLTVLGAALGGAVLGRIGARRSLPLTAAVFIGVLAMLMVRFLPIVGGVAWTLMALVALGAGVFAVTMAPHRNPAELIDSPGASNH